MMLKVLVYAHRTNRQWPASPEEAMIYISSLYGLASLYTVSELSTGRLLTPIELLSRIYSNRTEQRNRSV